MIAVQVRSMTAQALMVHMPEKTDGISDKELICPNAWRCGVGCRCRR
jgi:hypothetical protein